MAGRKPILCLDFDGVIHSYASGWRGAAVVPDDPVPGAMEFILEAREHFDVAVYSSRSGQPGGIAAMKGWMVVQMLAISQEAGGHHDFGEETVAGVVESLSWPTEKPAAMVTLDDRAITFTGVWPQIDELRAFRPWNRS